MPRKLYFEHALHHGAFESVFIRNISESGILVTIPFESEIYIGERVLVEFSLQPLQQRGDGQERRLGMTCQARRSKQGIRDDGTPCWESGLDFYEMTAAQRQTLLQLISRS